MEDAAQDARDAAPHTERRFRSKAVAGLLAVVAGVTGAHRLYLGSRFWWVYPVLALPPLGWALQAEEWFRHPGFFAAAAVQVAALLESIVFCLAPDERWDARWNPGSARRSASGWPAVLVAIAALTLGAILTMSVLAIALEGYFASRLNR